MSRYEWKDYNGNILEDPVITIVLMTGDDMDRAEKEVESLQKEGHDYTLADYMSQWDYGDENDSAASAMDEAQEFEEVNRLYRLEEVEVGGITYYVCEKDSLGSAILYRRPLN